MSKTLKNAKKYSTKYSLLEYSAYTFVARKELFQEFQKKVLMHFSWMAFKFIKELKPISNTGKNPQKTDIDTLQTFKSIWKHSELKTGI